jgi:hypothetical protein
MPLRSFKIKPYVGVGRINLGMIPEEVHEILGEPENIRVLGGILDEYYFNQGLLLQYKADQKKCVAISMMSPADPVYLDRHPMHESWRTASKWLRKIDSNIQEIGVGLIGHDTGIHLAHAKVMLPRNGVMRNVDVVNVVIVFAKGYWDRSVDDPLPYTEEDSLRFQEEFPEIYELLMSGVTSEE